MDIRQLKTFIEVAKLKSFSLAAKKLFITQPTATNHIQSLESKLDTTLINRSGRSVNLTEPGALLYKHAINIVNSCEMAVFDLAEYKDSIKGHLSIYSSSVPRKYILPYIMKDFLKKYNDITFSLSDKGSKDVVNSILKGDTDFGIIGAKYPSRQLNYTTIMEDEILLVTPDNSNYSKPSYSHLSIKDLLEENFLLRGEGSGTRKLVEEKLKNNNMDIKDFHIIASIEDNETIKEMIYLEMGISFLSKKSIIDDVQSGKLKAYYIDEFDLNRKFYFVHHNKRQLSPINETFKTFILSHITKTNR